MLFLTEATSAGSELAPLSPPASEWFPLPKPSFGIGDYFTDSDVPKGGSYSLQILNTELYHQVVICDSLGRTVSTGYASWPATARSLGRRLLKKAQRGYFTRQPIYELH